MSIFLHEQLYRSSALMEQLKRVSLTICGSGALGGNLVENLARSGFSQLKIIDRDRIEERNLSTQPYYKSDVGAYKATIMTNSLYRSLGVTVDSVTKELNQENVHLLLKGSDLVVDTFDNSTSRAIVKDYCLGKNISCFHVGLSANYSEMIWNECYRIPSPINDDVCDYPLARNLVMATVAIASEIIINYLATGNKENYTFTLGDFAVKPFQG
jgi:molybdopterin-synthase adenylyltransferase